MLPETLVSTSLNAKSVKIKSTGKQKGYRVSTTRTDDRVHVARTATGKRWLAAVVEKVSFIVAAAEWGRLFSKTAELYR